jgi:transcriptional regulator with XRE-family HTH domain
MATQASGDRSIGANLRKAREGHGWSRETLAGKAGVSVATVARTELYGNVPRLDLLSALAVALEIGLADLIGSGSDSPSTAGAA